MPNQIPINPALPKNFDITPNEKRSKAQLDAWWDHPYCVESNGKYHVYCLNGGAWDRPTLLGQTDTYDKACELAELRQAEWVKRRAEPIFYHSFEPPFQMIRQPQRPDQDATLVVEFNTMDELNAYSQANQ
ncbi:DNA-binding protein [Salmonella enterica]|nr:DNA-binding protein [Salmonella enterica]EKA1639280.1 DNA-binding protein [Salmonella enterica]ELS1746371.1 DNA-binding protein [Salmonella enterica]ELW3720533.1 DNA-binding protein [Salmonella enterica]EMB7326561.1 DNA-binding protein [Salmonella enterica]